MPEMAIAEITDKNNTPGITTISSKLIYRYIDENFSNK